jgi:hypothetical protein
MKMGKKIYVLAGAFVFVVIGAAATGFPDNEYKNLKILPKKISKQEMDKVMEEFEVALGVKCDFCHVKQKNNPDEWDYASDEKPEKNVARKMIDMSNKINKQFFEGKMIYGQPSALLEIRCVTCHHGAAHPAMLEEDEEKENK